MATFGQAPIGTGDLSSSIKIGQPAYTVKVYGNMVASNQINITIDGVAVTTTTFTTDTPNTMNLLAANLTAHAKVSQAEYLGYNQAEEIYRVRFIGTYPNQLTISVTSITGGATQPQIEIVYEGGVNEVPFKGVEDTAPRLSIRVDSTTATAVIYGYALANSSEGDPVWYLYQVDTATANTSKTLFPNTGAGFDYSWTGRGSITFS